MQAAKILDVTRSFIPVNPNAYPENQHGTEQEDSPEKRVPVVPYKGHNFLPTAHGYKSFFGANVALGIDSLAPNKPDHIFLFQNLAYTNVVIALCDTGIWAKRSDSAGVWTQLVAMVAPAEATFYEWYFEIIKNKLYAFRANGDAFYTIETDIADPLGVKCTVVVPNFITLTAQLGMFRLGARLGFWDGENAVAWSNPDDFADFTPNVITGANVTTFNSVTGKISAIRPHGNNAIIYASKSVVALLIDPGETFFVKAIPVLQNTGVPYARQSCVAIPSNVHFAYTTTGIYKIDDGKPEIIVPEIYDYFKGITIQPVYLKLLQGRYLCFEVLDANAISGVPQFSTTRIAEASVTFPGYNSLDGLSGATETPDLCIVTDLLSDGMYSEQQAQAEADIPPDDKKSGTFAEPIYTAYLSRKGVVDVSNLTWTSPCGGVGPQGTIFDMSPVGASGNTLGSMTTDSTNKTAHYGPDSWIDGKWTMQRFVQAQSAIWKQEEAAIQEFLSAVKSRAFAESKTTEDSTSCVVSNPDFSYCDVGEFVSQFSDYKFGFNKCSFWLTRYVLETEVIKARSKLVVQCTQPSINPYAITDYVLAFGASFSSGGHASAEEAAAALSSPGNTYVPEYAPTASVGGPYLSNGTNMSTGFPAGRNYMESSLGFFRKVEDGALHPTATLYCRWLFPAGMTGSYISAGTATVRPVVAAIYEVGHFKQQEDYTIANILDETRTGVLGVESAYCELTHWRYTDKNGVSKIVPASACLLTDDSYPNTAPSGQRAVPVDDPRPGVLGSDGSWCGIPYESFDGVDWPAQTITLPETSFLLQNGGIAPKYPTIYGFFCYDLHLKKWGKAKLGYKQLLDYSPVNSDSSSPTSFVNFGILAGVIKEDGLIYIFDEEPSDSEITWGKIGYYRLGMSDIEEVRFDFASLCSGNILIDISIDGQQISSSLQHNDSYVNALQVIAHPPYSAKWFNITLQGKYDVSFGEVKMHRKGRR